MKRSAFFKSLLIAIVSPTIFIDQRSSMEIKKDNLINKKPPEGYALGIDEYHRECGEVIRLYSKRGFLIRDGDKIVFKEIDENAPEWAHYVMMYKARPLTIREIDCSAINSLLI